MTAGSFRLDHLVRCLKPHLRSIIRPTDWMRRLILSAFPNSHSMAVAFFRLPYDDSFQLSPASTIIEASETRRVYLPLSLSPPVTIVDRIGGAYVAHQSSSCGGVALHEVRSFGGGGGRGYI